MKSLSGAELLDDPSGKKVDASQNPEEEAAVFPMDRESGIALSYRQPFSALDFGTELSSIEQDLDVPPDVVDRIMARLLERRRR